MKNNYSPYKFGSLLILALLVSFSACFGQIQAGSGNPAQTKTESVSMTTVGSPIVFSSATSSSLNNATAVLVVANIEGQVASSSDKNVTGYYELYDGSTSSAEISRFVVAKEYTDYGLAAVANIFTYGSSQTERNYSLRHRRESVAASRNVFSTGNMLAIVLDDDNVTLPYSVKSISDETVTLAEGTKSIALTKTSAINLSNPAGIYLNVAFSTFGTVAHTGTWGIYTSTTVNGTYTLVPGGSITRSHNSNVDQSGAATITVLLENQSVGDHFFEVRHSTTAGTMTTRNLTLVAVGLADKNSPYEVYPTFSGLGGSATSTSSSLTSAITQTLDPSISASNSFFIHSTFNMSSSTVIAPSAFSFSEDGDGSLTPTPITFRRYIPAGGTGSGGLVGLLTGLGAGDIPKGSLNHQSDGSSTLTTDNINIVGFQLNPQTPVTWGGGNGGDWNTASNWSPSTVPTAANFVQISSGYPIVAAGASADCHDLVIDGTGGLTITSDNTSGSGTLIVGGSSSGNVTYERYMTGVDEWHLISSPVVGQLIGTGGVLDNTSGTNNVDYSSTNSNYAMSDYNEASNLWKSFFPLSVSGAFTSGLGYQVLRKTDGTISFVGSVLTDDLDKSLVRGGFGWNCIGNPYPSAMNLNMNASAINFLSTNADALDDSFGAIYCWDGASGVYETLNSVIGAYIPPGQAFFVKAAADAATVSITEAMQSHGQSPFKLTSSPWPKIILKASNREFESSTIVCFNSDMTRGLDVSYDAGMFKSDAKLCFYTKLVEDNGIDFAIQCLPDDYENLVIPLGLDAVVGDGLTFTAETSGLPEDAVCYLEDRNAGIFTRLDTTEASYSVKLTEDNLRAGTFYIHTGVKFLGIDNVEKDSDEFKFIVNQPEGLLSIIGEVKTNTKLRIYDLAGRLRAERRLLDNSYNTVSLSGLNRGIYLLQFDTGKIRINEKISW